MYEQQQVNKPFHWSAWLWSLIFYWYFSCVIQIIIVTTGHGGFNGLRDSLLFSTLWVIPGLLLPHKTRLIALIIGIILWAASLIALGYYLVYQQEFSQSVLFVMFESNAREASEYLSQYFSYRLVLWLLAYTLGAILLWTRVRPVYFPRRGRYTLSLLILLALIGFPVAKKMVATQFSISSTANYMAARMGPAAPWQFMMSYAEYRQQLSEMELILQRSAKIPPLKNLKDANGDTPRTLVMVIGESTSSNRMSLYGYGRKTTPLLDAMHASDPNFAVFNNVVTSRPYTIEILQQALTFADETAPDRYLSEPSLMNMMKQAGYKTFWITNQQTITQRNTMLTAFSKQTDEQYYLNQQRTQSARQYDGVVTAPFEQVLADPAPRKFIVVHLLGTHMNYQYRYPQEFNVFQGRDSVVPKSLSDDQVNTYNHYDNAQRYNDFIVTSLMESYARSKLNGFLLYFSDHGEEVYDTPSHNILGRNEGAPTQAMYNIPLLIWISPSWQASHPTHLNADVNRLYSSAHLIHTWSDLAGLSYDTYEPHKSLVNPGFIATPRLIGNPYLRKPLQNFDSLFGSHPVPDILPSTN